MEVGLKDTDPDYSRESVMQVASVHEFPSHVVIETAMDVKESSVQVQAEKAQEKDVQKDTDPDYSREPVMQVASAHESPSHVVIETPMDMKESWGGRKICTSCHLSLSDKPLTSS